MLFVSRGGCDELLCTQGSLGTRQGSAPVAQHMNCCMYGGVTQGTLFQDACIAVCAGP